MLVEQVWTQWNYERYHESIRHVNVPVLIVAGDREASIGMTREVLQEDARRIRAGLESNADPTSSQVAVKVEVRIFEGFSHMFWWEQVSGVRGADLLLGAMDEFFGWGKRAMISESVRRSQESNDL